MSRTIDERVVEMRFDNSQFEDNVQTSLSTLDKLKQSLDFVGSTNSLGDFGSSTSGLTGMGDAVDGVKSKFSALETIATGALLKLGSMITDVTMNLLDQVNPLNQLSEGWNKYAEKTTSVQTIMAATRTTWEQSAEALGFEGTQMEFVSEQLDKLNWFTDETSYSFNDMVGNIGKFTNNNIPLEEAVTSMEGIATWAGLSGANVQDASRAMYNFSQAMGAGAMKLQDWKSIENANMATTEFKQAAIDTAIELGRLIEVEDGVYKATEQWGKLAPEEFTIESFSTQLSSLWMNKDVMTATLEKFGGFTDELNKFYNLVGDHYDTTSSLLDDLDKFKELSGDTAAQTEMLREVAEDTGISVDDLRKAFEELNSEEYDMGKRAFRAAQEAKTFQEAIDSVKDAASTAWMRVFESIFGNYEQAKQLWTGLANSLWDAFVGPVDRLATIMGEWNKLGGRDSLLEALNALGEVADAVFGAVAEAFGEVFGVFDDHNAAKSLKDLTDRFRDFAKSLKPSEEQLQKIKAVATVVATVLKTLGDAVKNVAGFVAEAVRNFINFLTTNEQVRAVVSSISTAFMDAIKWVSSATTKFGDFTKKVKETEGIKRFIDLLKDLKNSVAEFGGKVVDKIAGIFEKIGSFKFDKAFAGLSTEKISDFFSGLTDKLVSAKESVGEFFNSFKDNNVLENIAATFDRIKTSIGEFASSAWDKITEKIWSIFSPKDKEGITAFGESFLGSSNLLQTALEKLGEIVPDVFEKIGTWLGEGFTKLADAAGHLGEFKDKLVALITPAKEFISAKLHEAFQKLADVFETLKGIDPGRVLSNIADKISSIPKIGPALEKTFTVIGNFFAKVRDSYKEGGIGAAIETLIEPLRKLKDILVEFATNFDFKNPFKSISEFFSGISTSFGNLKEGTISKVKDLFTTITDFVKKIDPEEVMQIAGIAGGLITLITTWKMFSGIGKATSAAAELIEVLTKKMKPSKLAEVSIFLGALSFSIISLAGSIKVLGQMDGGDLAKGELAVAGIGAIILAFEKLSTSVSKANVATIVALTAAVWILSGEIKKLSQIPWEELVPATLALDSVILSLGGSMKLMSGFSGLSFGGFIEAVILLAGVVYSLKFLTDGSTDVDALLTASKSLSLVLLSVGGTLAIITSFASNTVAATAAIKNFDLFLADLILVLGTLGAIDELTNGGFSKVTADGGKVLAVLGEALGKFVGSIIGGIGEGIADSLPDIGSNLTTFAENIEGFLDIMSNDEHDLASIADGALNLSKAMLNITKNNWYESIVSFFTGIGSMDKFKQDLMTFAEGITGYMKKMSESGVTESSVTAATKAAEVLVDLKNKLQDTGGLKQAFTGIKSWQEFVNGIGKFADGIIEFGKKDWSEIDLTNIDNAKTVVQKMVDIKRLLPDEGGVVQWFSGSEKWDTFAKGLNKFSAAIIDFAGKDWTNVKTETFQHVYNCVSKLAGLKKLFPKENGFIDIFIGEKDWVGFSLGLGSFGDAIIGFANLSWPEDMVSTIESACEAGGVLAKLKDKLPDDDFMDKFIIGGYDKWSSFSAGLSEFGNAIIEYVNLGWSDDDAKAVENSASAVKALQAIKEGLPDTDWLEWFIGYSAWDSFADGLDGFGEALGRYSDVVTGQSFDSAAIEESISAANALAGIGSIVGSDEGLFGKVWNFFVGGNEDFKGFKENLVSFAQALAAYCDELRNGNVNTVTMQSSADSAKILVDLMKLISESALATNMNDTLTTFGDNLVTFVNKLSTFSTLLSGIDWSNIETAITNIQALADLITDLVGLDVSGAEGLATAIETIAQTSIDDFCNAFVNSVEQVNTAIDTMVEYAISELTAKAPEFDPTGVEAMNQFILGVSESQEAIDTQMNTTGTTSNDTLLANVMSGTFYETGRSADSQFASGIADAFDFISNAVNAVCNAAVDVANQIQGRMYEAGANASRGLADGIYANIGSIQAAASAAAQAATISVQTAFDINSPSKVWRALGIEADEGLAQGINWGTKDIVLSAQDMANETTSALTEVLSALDSEGLNGEYSPVITPVLDLSNFTADAKTMNDLLDQNTSIGFSPAGLGNGLFGSGSSSEINYVSPVINVYAQPGMDANEIADLTLKKFNNQMKRRKAAFA